MSDPTPTDQLPPIPPKRYSTIGEVSDLCDLKTHVLRYWEQEFDDLKPVKRRGNRRYYQEHDILLVRRIRALLYDQGYTIGGARQKLTGGDEKQDQTHARLLVRQTIAELEDVLAVLRS